VPQHNLQARARARSVNTTPPAVAQGQLERAFALALGKNDVAILLWLCGKLEPRSLAGPPPMAPIVLLSLVQQLSVKLESDTKTKLVWLKEALGVLNPHDPQISPSIGRVLQNLDESLVRASDALGDGALASDLSLLTFMVKKLRK